MDTTYQIGDDYPLLMTFKDKTTALANPASITVETRAPDGTITTVTWTGVDGAIIKSSTGIFTYSYTIAASGDFKQRITSTAPVKRVKYNTFSVQAAQF